MKIGIQIGYSAHFPETMANLIDLESVGLDRVVISESYGFDAVSQIGYAAALTSRVELAFGILPLYTRTPTNLAMTAAGVDYVSGGRCVLGIGVSGPQVIEGFHGVKHDAPLGRTREHVDICRKIWRRETSEYRGRHYTLPLTADEGGSGLGKPLKLMTRPVRDRIPMLLAAIGPSNVALAAELFDEWQPHLFHPGRADRVFGEALSAGKASRDADLDDLGVTVGAATLISDDPQAQESALDTVRQRAALYIGGMGASGRNFYNTLFARYGYTGEAQKVQELYLAGDKQRAAAAIPDEFARAISLIGPAASVKEALQEFASAGVTCVIADPLVQEPADRIRQIASLKGFAA